MIRDDFAGCGGWDQGARLLGVAVDHGIEINADAVATARAAGHARTHTAVADVRGQDWSGMTGYIASPPCQTFSISGSGSGRAHMNHLLTALGRVFDGWHPEAAVASVTDDKLDERSVLVLEPAHVIAAWAPTWVAFEQVPGVMPIWQAYAHHMRQLGYHVDVGYLSAEAFGVPQTRRRAFLIAHKDRPVHLPQPTHSRYNPRQPEQLELGVAPWVSMGHALSLAVDAVVGFPRRYDGQGRPVSINGVDYRERDLRAASEPSFTVTEKARSWKIWEPEFNDQSGSPYDPDWPYKRPATVVAGRGLVQNPGATANRFNGSTKSRNDGVRVTVAEAGILQGFPVDYPWSGTTTSKHQRVGDAVCPPVAAAVLAQVV